MKKWMVVLTILIFAGYLVSPYSPWASPDREDYESVDSAEQDEAAGRQDDTLGEDEVLIEVTKGQIYTGDLLLINKEHSLVPGNEAQDLIPLSKYGDFANRVVLLERSTVLSEEAAEAFLGMVKAAQADGVHYFMVSSGYRDDQEQNELYEKKGAEYAMPAGYSEHNLGLALDVGSTQGGIEQSAEGIWLRENAWKYGFIMRYPKDKENITGIQYEPWHFRYIGLPHSAIMQEKGLVLEEYFGLLKSEHSLSAEIDGRRYAVHYHPVAENRKIAVPAANSYTLSGNNVDGVIVTERLP